MKAIILAAGLGSRFKEITKKTHKALLPINDIPNLERTIQFLHEAGIKDIYIVTGHLRESFEYLIEKYNVSLVYNDKYKEYNSIYSMNQVLNFLGNSFVIDSDVVLLKNLFLEKPNQSTYYTVLRDKSSNKEWIPILNNNKVQNIIVSDEYRPSLLGISFWSLDDAKIIQNEYIKFLEEKILYNSSLYWDNIPMSIIDKLDVTTIEIEKNIAFEMDNLIDYKKILEKLDK